MSPGRSFSIWLAGVPGWLGTHVNRFLGTLPPIGAKVEGLPTPPLSFADAEGRTIVVRVVGEGGDDREGLVAMYDDFDPAHRAQGTPPLGEAAIRSWLDRLDAGENVLAVHEGRVVGHVSFVPDGTDRHELAIFVHQNYQRAGIGTQLIRAGLGHAREQGIGYVWLSVEAWKRGAQKLYSDAGFSTVNPMGGAHRMSRLL